jgi:Shedu protein SduA, C-terminal
MTNIWTPSAITMTHSSLFTSSDLERFEKEILTNPEATEREASAFFANFPKFLYLGQGAEIRREVVLFSDTDSRSCRADFFRRSYGKVFWDLIEIKDPNKPFFIGHQSQHPRVSSEVEKAISQALDYREFIAMDATVRNSLLQQGITVFRPQIIVVVGKHNDKLEPEQTELLYDRIRQRGGVEALSYNDLYRFALEHYESGRIFVTRAYFDPYPASSIKLDNREIKLLKELLKTGYLEPRMRYDRPLDEDDRSLLKLEKAGLILLDMPVEPAQAWVLSELGRRIAINIGGAL